MVEEPVIEPEPVIKEPKDLIVVTPPAFVFEPGKYTQTGDRVPDEEIKTLDKFETKKSLQAAEPTGNEPKPSLRSVDESGLLTIDWDKMMQKPANLDLIKTSEYAVVDEGDPAARSLLDTRQDRRRQLARRREWFNTDDQYLKYLLVIEALEIEIIASFEDGLSKEVPFTWDLVVFAEFDIQIQLYFRQEEMRVSRNQVNNVSVTFWGTEFFKSIDENEVRYGERIETVIKWQVIVLPEEAGAGENMASLVNSLVVVATLVSIPVLLMLQRSLLSLWIMLITLQLIAHMALMSSLMPVKVLVFLR